MRTAAPSVSLAADAVAFLVVAPLIGSAVGSLGFWLLALVAVPPIALISTFFVSAIPGMLALSTARLVRSGRIRASYAPGIAAGIGMVTFLQLSDGEVIPFGLGQEFEDPTVLNVRAQAWLVVAAIGVGWWALRLGSRMRRPLRTVGLIVGGLAGYWAFWSVMT